MIILFLPCGFLLCGQWPVCAGEAVIAVLVVAAIVFGIKAVFYKKQLSLTRSSRAVRDAPYNSLPHRQKAQDVDDELIRLKREMGD